jgi:AcrR family transcriptional regulator
VAKKISLRRQPRQERGQRRLDRILDAADRVFARVGYEAATTNAIARQAKTAIGSLYQFFPNKEAILDALAARYRRQLAAVHDAVLTAETARLPLPDLYDRIIGALAEFHAAHRGFAALFYGSATSGRLAAAAAELHQECIRRVEAMMAASVPNLDPALRRVNATINVEVIRALLPLAETGDEEFRRLVLGEIKNLLVAHARQAIGARADVPR